MVWVQRGSGLTVVLECRQRHPEPALLTCWVAVPWAFLSNLRFSFSQWGPWLQGGPELERITGISRSVLRPAGSKVWEKFSQGLPTVSLVQTKVINLSHPQTLKSHIFEKGKIKGDGRRRCGREEGTARAGPGRRTTRVSTEDDQAMPGDAQLPTNGLRRESLAVSWQL